MSNCVCDYLWSPSLESTVARFTKQNYHTASKKKNLPQTVEQIVSTIKTLRNIHCVVTYQRDGRPPIVNTLLESLNCYLIISASEKLEQATLIEYKKLHKSPEPELRSLGVELHYYPNIKRIFSTRGIKRRTIGERREAKKRHQ